MNKYIAGNELQLKEDTLCSSKSCILFVSENELECEIAFDMLESLGYTAIISLNGKHALDVYKRLWKVLDIVIINLVMPQMNGLEMFEAMRRINPKLKAVLCSGYRISDKVLQHVNQAILGFIQKPYDKAELSQKLDEVIRVEPIPKL